MTGVLGLDASTKRTGVALPTGRLLTWTPNTTQVARRLHWFEGQLTLTLRLYQPDRAAIEGYAPHSIGTLSTIRLAELGGVLRKTLFEHGVDYIEIPPSELKKWATGHGNADKTAMIAAAQAHGARPRNHDEADAALLRYMAIARHTDRPRH